MINQFDPMHKRMLENLQGNILKGHGRSFTRNIFFKVFEVQSAVLQKEIIKDFKKWLRQIADNDSGILISAKKQMEQNLLFKKHNMDGGVFACLHLTYKGYRTILGQKDADEKMDKTKNSSNFVAFKGGMQNAALTDDPVNSWDAGLGDCYDGMLIIADNDENNLNEFCVEIQKQISKFAQISCIQEGAALENDEGEGIEHFGYVDGISQPLFFEDEMDKFLANHGLKDPKQLKYNPAADLDLVLVDDPFIRETDAFGSFFVFRKLEQNVKGFKKAEKVLGFNLGLSGEDAERAGAMIVGRFEDGTPVEVSDTNGILGKATFNNFDYDPNDSSKCPYHAHIRKTNPRSDIGVKEALTHIMARRGIPFGNRKDNPNDGIIENKPEGGVGLLFMSYQADISNQFELIQRTWANEVNFSKDNTGIDLIIGNGKAQYPSANNYPLNWGKAKNEQIETFDKFVTLKGGEYFFAPSIPFLKSL